MQVSISSTLTILHDGRFWVGICAVSYTHLDVYKRQIYYRTLRLRTRNLPSTRTESGFARWIGRFSRLRRGFRDLDCLIR